MESIGNTVNNLNPYGHGANVTRAENTGDLHQYAMDRAREKLARTRQGHPEDKKVGVSAGTVVGLAVLCGFVTLLLGLGASAVFEKSPVASVVMIAIILIFWAGFAYGLISTAPTTPKRALVQFYRSLGNGKFKRSRGIVCAADLDNTGRSMPHVANLGFPSGGPYVFNNSSQFDSYWTQLLRDHSMPYCRSQLKKFNVTEISEDIVIVDFHLTVTRNTQLWMFLILVALLLAVIVDMATRKVTKIQMRKVLIKVGDEWKVFSGDWQGYDEIHQDWLVPV